MRKCLILATALRLAIGPSFCNEASAASTNNQIFGMVVSNGARGCLPRAAGRVTVTEVTGGQHMHVELFGLPKNTLFEFFLIQVPNAPFGTSWYQGEIRSDNSGNGAGDFAGIFSRETFVVAPGSAPAPVIFPTDANTNPATRPVHQHHLGFWFDSPTDATKAGCAGTTTPFNGTHDAGIQVLNTSNYPDLAGPLQRTE